MLRVIFCGSVSLFSPLELLQSIPKSRGPWDPLILSFPIPKHLANPKRLHWPPFFFSQNWSPSFTNSTYWPIGLLINRNPTFLGIEYLELFFLSIHSSSFNIPNIISGPPLCDVCQVTAHELIQGIQILGGCERVRLPRE